MTSQLARASLTGIAVAVVALAGLHVLAPELDPRWSVLSQYSLTPVGWLMSVCFMAAALACIGVAAVLRPHADNRRGKVGIVLLFVGALGLVLAAFFHIDPLDTPPEAMSVGAQVHNLASLLGNCGLIAGALLLTASLRHKTTWLVSRPGLLISANLAWIGIVLMVVCIVLVVQSGTSGPWYVGFANRMVFVAELAWLGLAVRPLLRSTDEPVSA